MKLLRFMSHAEFAKYRAGELLENETKHQAYTDAVGFCFLDADDYDAQYAWEFLSGIASSDIAAIFEVENVDALKKGSGTFADPQGSFFQGMTVIEYSTPRYHNKEGGMKLLKYCDDFADRHDDDYKNIFDWKEPGAPIKRKIPVIDKTIPPRPPKPNTPEQRLLDAIEAYAKERLGVELPEDFFDDYSLNGAPSLSIERNFDGEVLSIEGLTFSKGMRARHMNCRSEFAPAFGRGL